jgi:hypothetical protein
MERYGLSKSTNFKKISGRPASQALPENLKLVEKLHKTRPSTSVRQAAKKLNLPMTTLVCFKRDYLGIRGFVKRTAPKYIKDKKQRAKTGCRRIHRKSMSKILILADETYAALDPSDVMALQYFHATTPTAVKYEEEAKP